MTPEQAWRDHPSLYEWLNQTRLSIARRMPGQSDDPAWKLARDRIKVSAAAAYANLARFVAEADLSR